ncbi:MAG: SDR family oxidoreductase [Lachnospiraceae bacterium]|nr:SDR family oxidoreductase [Lachnospiraceae bacterium]
MKNILITGASRGIGRAIALKMAESGCNIFLNALCQNGTERLEAVKAEIEGLRAEKKIPGETFLVPCDVGDPEAVRDMFERIRNTHTNENEGIDILINNAGISHIGLIQDMTDEEWNRIISVNLSSIHYCSRAVIPHMLAVGEGRILNISSVWGNIGASCEVAYSATKGGVNAYTKALAKELAPSNIAVNAIACGCIDTDMNRNFDEDERAELCSQIPTGRFASPEEVADLAASICSGSTYLTGQVITFDGGWT